MKRIIFDITEMLDFFISHTHATGIQRVQIDVLDRLAGTGLETVPVFFSSVLKCYCEVDAKKIFGRDIRYIRNRDPFRKTWFKRLRAAVLLAGKRFKLRDDDVIFISGAAAASPLRNQWLAARGNKTNSVFWMCYDLIPVRHPEYCQNPALTKAAFQAWLDRAILDGDRFICISNFVADDLRNYALGLGRTPGIDVMPLAHEFAPAKGPVAAKVAQLQSAPFVLFVSSLNMRKNQDGLVELWIKLHQQLGERLPTLVLAGRSWGMEHLFRRLAATENVSGKVVHLADLTDADLHFLYEHCAFTIFPSLYEGWGLPVGESLWMGKPCLSSNKTSLPEAGGNHVTYFDPSLEGDMERVVRNALSGKFDAMPPEHHELRTWKMVADEIAALLQVNRQ